jgi:hypothetical protein
MRQIKSSEKKMSEKTKGFIMKTIMTEERKQIIEKVKKTGCMSCWDEFGLIPTLQESVFQVDEMQEVDID